MVFLRPHIVRTAQDGASLTLDRYNYMRAAQENLPVKASWLVPGAATANLPDIQRDPATGLLDLRGAGDAPAQPDTPQSQAIPAPTRPEPLDPLGPL